MVALRPHRTASEGAQWPPSPVATPTQAGLSSQQDTGPGCCKLIFFSASAASLQEKNHTARPKVFISHLLSALFFHTVCSAHWNQNPGWRLWALEFPEFFEECITS